MRYTLSLNLEGAVSGRLSSDWHVLNLTGSGEPPDSTDQWQITGQISWPQSQDAGISGRLKLLAPMGATLHGAFADGQLSALTDESGAALTWRPDLEFIVDEATGWLAGVRGTIGLSGTLTFEDFRLTANFELAAPDDARMPPTSGLLSEDEQNSGGSYSGRDVSERTGRVRAARSGLESRGIARSGRR